jgi:hypothetical protein
MVKKNTGQSKAIILRLKPDTIKTLQQLAQDQSISVQELIRLMIQFAIDNN